MELANLGSARRSALTAAAGFLLVGGALYFAVRSPVERAPRSVDVVVAEGQSEATAVDEAVLLAEAWRLNWPETDPIVAGHLERMMRFSTNDPNATREALVAEALELGLHRTDPTVRAHLLERARRSIGEVRDPTEEELTIWREDHAESYRRPDLFQFATVYLKAKAAPERVASTVAQLNTTPIEDAYKLGDPILDARAVQITTAGQVRARWGDELATALEAAPKSEWVGPTSSAYGMHWLYVIEVTKGEVPELDPIRARVVRDWQNHEREAVMANRMASLRDQYQIRIVEP